MTDASIARYARARYQATLLIQLLTMAALWGQWRRITILVGISVVTMLANVLGFWLIGMPVSLALGFGAQRGVTGLWWGFVAGLAAVATFLVLRVRVRLSGTLARVRVDEAAVGAAP